MIEARHLRYFLVTAEQLSFTAAAKTLHLAQPALSINIKHLEEELGVPLFNRSNNKVSLTEAGQFFRNEAANLLQRLNHAASATRRIGERNEDRLSIGFYSHVFFSGLSRPIERLQQALPGVRIDAQECLHDELLPKLKAREFDIICSDIDIPDRCLDSYVIKPLPLFCAIPSRHPLARAEKVLMSDLMVEPLLFPLKSENHEMQALARQQSACFGVKHNFVAFFRSFLGGLGMVQCGMGLMVCYELNVGRLDGVVIRPLVDGVDISLRAFWRKGEPMSGAIRGFLDACAESIG